VEIKSQLLLTMMQKGNRLGSMEKVLQFTLIQKRNFAQIANTLYLLMLQLIAL
jgi:hypothetical protein